MVGPHERTAHSIARKNDAFILRYELPDGSVRAVMETDEYEGVGGLGPDRESAFHDLVKAAEVFDWPTHRGLRGSS